MKTPILAFAALALALGIAPGAQAQAPAKAKAQAAHRLLDKFLGQASLVLSPRPQTAQTALDPPPTPGRCGRTSEVCGRVRGAVEGQHGSQF